MLRNSGCCDCALLAVRRGGKPYVELHEYNGNAEVVEVPDCVTTIGNLSTFANDNIKKIILPEKITGVDMKAFSENVRKKIASTEMTFVRSLESQINWNARLT